MTDKAIPEKELDPRVRRTRHLLQKALTDLLQEKQFDELSITDITKRADLARVTFYQHYESKEALLLTLISGFFEQMYAMFDAETLAQVMGESDVEEVGGALGVAQPIEPKQVHLIRVGLASVPTAVREIAVTSFLQALQQSDLTLSHTEAHMIATYHVSGMLALLDTYLNNELPIPATNFQAATLLLLRVLLQEVIASSALHRALTPATHTE